MLDYNTKIQTGPGCTFDGDDKFWTLLKTENIWALKTNEWSRFELCLGTYGEIK